MYNTWICIANFVAEWNQILGSDAIDYQSASQLNWICATNQVSNLAAKQQKQQQQPGAQPPCQPLLHRPATTPLSIADPNQRGQDTHTNETWTWTKRGGSNQLQGMREQQKMRNRNSRGSGVKPVFKGRTLHYPWETVVLLALKIIAIF